MPVEGYWISPDGQIQEVTDHFEFLRESPEVFGFTTEQAAKWTRLDREKILRKAIQKGFIRVRGHRHYTTFEMSAFTNNTAFLVKKFLEDTNAWPNETVEIHELDKRRNWSETAEFFLEEKFYAALGNPKRRKS